MVQPLSLTTNPRRVANNLSVVGGQTAVKAAGNRDKSVERATDENFGSRDPVRIRWVENADIAPIGQHPCDKAPLYNVPALQHVAQGLPKKDLLVQDLFKKRHSHFAEAPDPTKLLTDTQRANASCNVERGEELSVTSYNIALLDIEVTLQKAVTHIPILNIIFYLLFPLLFWFRWIKVLDLETPYLEKRKPHLPDLIFAKDDVLMLQEVWHPRDVAWLEREAKKRGFVAITSDRNVHNDGLMTLVRRRMIDAQSDVVCTANAFDNRWTPENIPGVHRGFQTVQFEHPQIGSITLLNTHLQPLPAQWMRRMEHAREIGLAAREIIEKDPQQLVLMGGDMNSGPYYRDDVWRCEGDKSRNWYRNAMAYGVIEHYSGMADAVVMGQSSDAADDDVELANAGPGPEGEPVYPFTASARSNALYAEQYQQKEPQARLDHLRINESNGRCQVVSSEMTFTEELDIDGKGVEPSDHYGVRVRVRVVPRKKQSTTPHVRLAPCSPEYALAPKQNVNALRRCG